ncbi:hypothetical protein DID77_04495 [Candidatus Marinamargulisbacteria bacterium SCGC AG-439-L15]|nr:hypothetical protein DID77_04495 [Candidatus Marinamargulisbacteria bacterium SCGC AG-439-L15]
MKLSQKTKQDVDFAISEYEWRLTVSAFLRIVPLLLVMIGLACYYLIYHGWAKKIGQGLGL